MSSCAGAFPGLTRSLRTICVAVIRAAARFGSLFARFFPEAAVFGGRFGLAHGLLGDFFQLHCLHHRQRRVQIALLRVADGAAIGLDAFGNRTEEFVLPLRKGNAGLVRRALGLLQGAQHRPLGGGLGVRLGAFLRSLRDSEADRMPQRPPMADRERSISASSSWSLALACFRMRMTLRII